jgi:hypothetical protein
VLKRLTFALVLLCVVLAASGCGGSSKPDVCGKRDDLSTAVDNLVKVNPVSDGMNEVQTRLTAVQDATTALGKAAGDEFAPQVKAVKESTAKVATDVKGLTGSDKTGALTALATDVPAVKTSVSDLLSAVGSACD